MELQGFTMKNLAYHLYDIKQVKFNVVLAQQLQSIIFESYY